MAQNVRLTNPGIKAVAEVVSFTFAGETLRGRAGETIAAALTAAGRLLLGERSSGGGRGLFCGMGTCQECLIEVNSIPGQRACMTELAAGMKIEPQKHRVHPRGMPDSVATQPTEHRPEVLIVGGGPAGLAAARAAATSGVHVVLLDERSSLGGQYFKQLAKTHRFATPAARDRQFREGQALIESVRALGVEVWTGATVWGAFAPVELAVLHGNRQHVFRPKRLIIATGAYERGVPFPGWTLPGVMTTGAAQTLQRAYQVSPGQRVLIAGNGPLNFQLGAELVAAGAQVAAVVESAKPFRLARLGALARALRRSPDLLVDGLGYLARLRRARIPLLFSSAVVAAEGGERVEEVVVAEIDPGGHPVPGSARRFAVDAVCAGYGFLPANEIARALGCSHRFDRKAGCLVPERDVDGLATPDVYIAGDCAGMGGARAALEQGFIAGIAAARSLGREPSVALVSELARCRDRLSRHQAFQVALWRIFDAPMMTLQLADDQTEICRCEGVTLKSAAGNGPSSLAEVKRRTRAGMGRCQARYCAPLIASLVEKSGVQFPDETHFLAPRPPIRPMSIDSLVEPLNP